MKKLITVEKFGRSPMADQIPNVSWISYYCNIFDAALCSNLFPKKIIEDHVLPVCIDRVKRSVERLKSKSYDIDGISAFHLNTESEELCLFLAAIFPDVFILVFSP